MFWRPVRGRLASGLREVEQDWDLQDLVEAHLWMDYQELVERRRAKAGAR